jgi:diacylglycerol kinase family enzyme
MRYLIYNPLSGKENQSGIEAESYKAIASMPVKLVAITEIANLRDFFEDLDLYDDVVIFGGDGTLNKVANALSGYFIRNDIYYYPCGTGNDFARDIDIIEAQEPIMINDYIKSLPTVTVNGKQCKFINGVGFGIDGYCCEVGDILKSQHKNPNYTAIAIKGLLFHFKPVNATVIVDGITYYFKKVWIAPTMFGRYYGGGMMPTPNQNRNAADKKVSLMVFHKSGKLKTLAIFPSIFKGEHIKKKKNVVILEGKNISVTFDRPASLQIDGETVLDVNSYSVAV